MSDIPWWARNHDRCVRCDAIVEVPHDCPHKSYIERMTDTETPPLSAESFAATIERGRERAAAELAKMPPDDGTVTVSVPDAAKIEREHFKLCRTCGWRRGPGGRCQCPGGP